MRGLISLKGHYLGPDGYHTLVQGGRKQPQAAYRLPAQSRTGSLTSPSAQICISGWEGLEHTFI